MVRPNNSDYLMLLYSSIGEVVRVERDRYLAHESSGSADELVDDDVMMADDSDAPPEKPKRKRKAKKVIPVGKNGLKKKRVVKSRMTTDTKGYMSKSCML
jgi:hypothetical protein